MNTPQENFRYSSPLESPEQLKVSLREQDFSVEAVEELAPVVQRLAEWQAPRPTPDDTHRLLARLRVHQPRLSPVRQYMQSRRANPGSHLYWLLLIARQQVGILRLSFWVLSALVACLGFLLVATNTDQNQIVLLRIGGPLLAYLATLGAFRGIDQGVLEFELACPPSPVQLTLARLVVVLGYDIGLGLLLSASLAAWSSESFLAITLHWLMPLLLVAGLGLLLTLRLPTLAAGSIAYGGWLVLLGVSSLAEKIGLAGINLSTGGEVALGFAGMALLALALLTLKKALPSLLTPAKFM